ncbi:MAG TPA: SpoIIE family protein phosphatase [Terriglobia bacterium]|nr:SpoIIE family protein phosphatase [Terriglobia bacterium]
MIRTFLVDDERGARERLRHLLSLFGDVEIVGEAENGEEALQRIPKLRPDLVFLDIQMPGGTGLEVARALEPPRPRIIFCTALDSHAISAFELHAIDYLLKPVNRTRLRDAVEVVRQSVADMAARHQIEMAQQVQSRMFPRTPPRVKGLDYSGICEAAQEVSGDYYDFIPIAAGKLAITIADISGKGVSAGLLMASLQGRLQTYSPVYGMAVGQLAGHLNRLMHASTQESRFITMFYAVYDETDRSLTYVNAGHNPPLLARSGAFERLEVGGTVLGPLPEAAYQQDTIQLLPSDTLILFTDGITEATNSTGEEFGEARLRSSILGGMKLPAQELRDWILKDADAFAGKFLNDDRTIVVAKVL